MSQLAEQLFHTIQEANAEIEQLRTANAEQRDLLTTAYNQISDKNRLLADLTSAAETAMGIIRYAGKHPLFVKELAQITAASRAALTTGTKA